MTVGRWESLASSAAHSAHPAQPPSQPPRAARVCVCAGAAGGVSHDAAPAGHLPAGKGEAEEAGTTEGLVVLVLLLMRVERCVPVTALVD